MSELKNDRRIIEVQGEDAEKFLQDLITNDIKGADGGLVYAALLSPQGKYLFDFFVAKQGECFLLDAHVDQADKLAQRLSLYKLRAKVEISKSDLFVNRGIGDVPVGAFADPRHPELGWRSYDNEQLDTIGVDFKSIRVRNNIPETGVELISDKTFILEAGFEALNGVDFRKGCYVGQEVTARMKHKTELRKGFAIVEIKGRAPIGTDIMAGDKVAGQLYSQSGNQAIAYLRFDRAGVDMIAGDAQIRYRAPT